jgi:2,3-diketo-5-methylthio-1-phosphopentane phosphatase
MSNVSSDRLITELALCRPQNWQIWLDFDGTVTQQDVLDELIKRYSINDSWKMVEERWQAGLIGSRQCLTEQFNLLRVSSKELDIALAEIKLDTGIFSLLELSKSQDVPVVILSDSADVFIKKILQRCEIENLPIRANAVIHHGLKLQLCFPHNNPSCQFGAAHCKCGSIEAIGDPQRKSIYIGDGRSDLCAARRADCVFAKGVLAKCLKKESIPFIEYSTLNDIVGILSEAWKISGLTCIETQSKVASR